MNKLNTLPNSFICLEVSQLKTILVFVIPSPRCMQNRSTVLLLLFMIFFSFCAYTQEKNSEEKKTDKEEIKPGPEAGEIKDTFENGYEFWLFTGTNLDLLDGVKAKDLYFKGSYLTNLKNGQKFTNHWLYFTFGKNRYVSDQDTISDTPFSSRVPTVGDSITIARGYYNSSRVTVTENLFASLDYMFKACTSNTSDLYVTGGFYFGLRTLKESYKNGSYMADTVSYLLNRDSVYRFSSILNERSHKQFNYNISVGILHILSTKLVNVKTHLQAGLNTFVYPAQSVKSGWNERVTYGNQHSLFVQVRMEATVLKPGISIGVESFIRENAFPLFNISLSKVIDFEQLGTLFGKTSTLK